MKKNESVRIVLAADNKSELLTRMGDIFSEKPEAAAYRVFMQIDSASEDPELTAVCQSVKACFAQFCQTLDIPALLDPQTLGL